MFIKGAFFLVIYNLINANFEAEAISCQCESNIHLIIYNTTSGKQNYSSWNETCNKGITHTNITKRNQSTQSQNNRNGRLFTDINSNRKTITDCLDKCNRRHENSSINFNGTKFWVGQRFHCESKQWILESGSLEHRIDDANRSCTVDLCGIYEYRNNTWVDSHTDCSQHNTGYVCQYDGTDSNAENTGLDKRDDDDAFEHQVSTAQNSVIASQQINNITEKMSAKVTAAGNFSMETANQQLFQMNEQLNKLERHEPVSMRSLRDINELLEKIATNMTGCKPALVKNFSQGVINVASGAFKSCNARNWIKMSEESRARHPMSIVNAVNKAMKAAKGCMKNEEIIVENEEIKVKIALLKYNSGNTRRNSIENNGLSQKETIIQPNANVEKKTTGVTIIYTRITTLLQKIQKMNRNINTTNQNNSTKHYISGSSMISYTVYQNDKKVSVPVHFTIPVSLGEVQQHRKPSCEFYDNSENKWSDFGCKVVEKTGTEVVCFCNHTTNFALLMVHSNIQEFMHKNKCNIYSIIKTLGYICNGLSAIFLNITVIALVFIKDTSVLNRSERLTSNINLSIAALAFHITLLFGDISAASSQAACVTNAFLTHYFHLATFAWMTIEGILLYLYTVRGNIRNIRIGWKKFLVGWVIPGIISGVTLLVGMVDHDYIYNTEAKNTTTLNRICWLNSEHHKVWASTGPILVSLLFNAFVIIKVLVVVARLSNQTKQYRPAEISQDLENNSKSVTEPRSLLLIIFKAFLKLYPMLGISFILGWLSSYVLDDKGSDSCGTQDTVYLITATAHSILNGLQGVFIFIVFVPGDEQVRNALERKRKMRGICKRQYFT